MRTKHRLNISVIAHAKIFDTLSQWTAVSYFAIEMNYLSGTLPDVIGSSWIQLDTFTVSENMLIGTIPSSIGNWSKARFFWIADNLFSGTLPETIGAWNALASFNVSCSWLRAFVKMVY
jgi:hypothetical protein